MKGAKSLQIHSHNIFSRLLSKEYGVYQQFIYIVTAFSESKIEAPWFEKYEQACWEWNTRAFEMNAILDIQSGLLPSDCCPTFLSFKKGTQWGFPDGSVVIFLPMQETLVRTLVREDSTCCRATKPMRHNS